MKALILSLWFCLLYLVVVAQPKDSYILYKGGPTFLMAFERSTCKQISSGTVTQGVCTNCSGGGNYIQTRHFFMSVNGSHTYVTPLGSDTEQYYGDLTLQTDKVVQYEINYHKNVSEFRLSGPGCALKPGSSVTTLEYPIKISIEQFTSIGTAPTTIQTYCDSIDFSQLYAISNMTYQVVSGGGTINTAGLYRPGSTAGTVTVKASKLYANGEQSHNYTFTVTNSNITLSASPGTNLIMGQGVTLQHNHSRGTNTKWDFGDGGTQDLEGNIGAHYYYSSGKKTIKVMITVPSGCAKWVTFKDYITVAPLGTDVITGNDDPLTAGKEIKVYPVPTENLIFIETKQALLGVLTITSMTGNLHYSKEHEFNVGVNEFDFQNIPAGIYLMRFKQGDFNQSFKIIKY